MEENDVPQVSKETLWYLDNYILLKDYYDRTISRIAARCVRMGNIAMEEYPFYPYILDVLEEISQTGEYVLMHQELHPYVEKKIQGGLTALKKNLKEYQLELKNNASPDMIRHDASEVDKMRDALNGKDVKAHDPTVGAGMSMDELMAKLTKKPEPETPDLDQESVPVAENTAIEQPDTGKKIIKVKRAQVAPLEQAVPPKVDIDTAQENNEETKTEEDD